RWSHSTNTVPVRPMWLAGRHRPRWQTHGVVCLRYTVNCHLGPQCDGASMLRPIGALLGEKCPWRQRAAIASRRLLRGVIGFSTSGQWPPRLMQCPRFILFQKATNISDCDIVVSSIETHLTSAWQILRLGARLIRRVH